MKYTITKKKVKQALITEPLKAGQFFAGRSKDNGRCSVCAVGSILRNTKVKTFSEDDAFSVTDSCAAASRLEDAYQNDNFLSILSTEFENGSNPLDYTEEGIKANSPEMRMFLLFLTEAFCPPTLKFEV